MTSIEEETGVPKATVYRINKKKDFYEDFLDSIRRNNFYPVSLLDFLVEIW